ncbi:hypothetical protein [Klebsiella michiganensis]|uniref:hypothetical protein n=1 Tax=Klebsiella michiganensis TaxID=1134687 RepID=UPI00062C4923|nr:hypothetical protein [Klebsiella michiganensis]
MTSKLTRERLQEIAEDGFLKHGESKELARMAMVAMDSEPVAEVLSSRPGNDTSTIDRALPVGTQLYRHAQQPVVPEEKPIPNTLSMYAVDAVAAIAEVKGWNACRAAMLQESQKSAGESNNCRSCENVQDLQAGNSPAQGGSRCSIKAAPALDSFKKNADARCGNSPVIPEGYVIVPKEPTAEMQSAGASAIRFDTTAVNKLWTGNAVFRAMLAAAQHDTPALNSLQSVDSVAGKWIPVSEQKPDCWCRTCRPVVLNDMRFVVCPDCGNKRCPRANDHRNACTGSNEPGQEGSAYPDTPREVKGE